MLRLHLHIEEVIFNRTLLVPLPQPNWPLVYFGFTPATKPFRYLYICIFCQAFQIAASVASWKFWEKNKKNRDNICCLIKLKQVETCDTCWEEIPPPIAGDCPYSLV